MNDAVQFEMPEVPTFTPQETATDSNKTGGLVAALSAIAAGSTYGALSDGIVSNSVTSTLNTGSAKAIGLAVKGFGGVASTAFGLTSEYLYTGKVPSAASVAETSAIAIASVLGGPIGGLATTGLIEFFKLGNVEGSAFNPAEFTRLEKLLDRAARNPDGPEAAYFRALKNGTSQDTARGAMNLPHMER